MNNRLSRTPISNEKSHEFKFPIDRVYIGAWLGVVDLYGQFRMVVNEPVDTVLFSFGEVLNTIPRSELYIIIDDLASNLPQNDILNQPERLAILSTDNLRKIIKKKLRESGRIIYISYSGNK
jgi:hypothetical protein